MIHHHTREPLAMLMCLLLSTFHSRVQKSKGSAVISVSTICSVSPVQLKIPSHALTSEGGAAGLPTGVLRMCIRLLGYRAEEQTRVCRPVRQRRGRTRHSERGQDALRSWARTLSGWCLFPRLFIPFQHCLPQPAQFVPLPFDGRHPVTDGSGHGFVVDLGHES